MNDDAVLLRRYAEENSEAAFTALVQQRLDLVYSAALRRTGGDAHRAADIAQQVFTKLAQEAGRLARHPALTAWLYTAARTAACDLRRAEFRRRSREHEAHLMHEILAPAAADAEWQRLRPVLDAAMDELSEADRTAVLLRYFEQRSYAEIGAVLRMREDAARMRTDRALEKLRGLLGKRGVASTAAALALALGSGSVAAAPAGLAATIAGTALGAAGGAMAATATMAGIFSLMSTTHFASTVSVLAAVAALSATAYNIGEKNLAEATLADARRAGAAATERLRDLERRMAGEAPPALRQAAGVAPASRPPMSPDASGTGPLQIAAEQAGREFLAAHPEARPLLDALAREMFDGRYDARLRALGYPPEERQRIAEAVAPYMQGRVNTMGITLTLGGGESKPVETRLREVLGDKEYQRYAELERKRRAQSVLRTLAMSTSGSDTPLQPAQAQALAEIIDRHSVVRFGGPLSVIANVDWKAVTEQAAPILSGPQAALFNAIVGTTPPAPVVQILPRP